MSSITPRTGTTTTRSRFLRRLGGGLATTALLGTGLIATTTSPAAAASRATIVSVAQGQLNNSSRNHESPMGSGCNFYTGYFRSWKPSSGCPSTDGVQWRDSDWCADFSKYVWKNAGVRNADIAETDGGVLTGWAASFKNYGTKYGTWHARSSGYTPQPGDAVVFDWDRDGDINHVGIVKSATSSTVYTIEGNASDRVKENSYSRSDGDIVGYSAPLGIDSTPDPEPEPVDYGVLDFTLSDSFDSNTNTRPVIRYGNSPMIPIIGDWDGDGVDTPSAYDPTTATFHLSNNPSNGQSQYNIKYGNRNSIPIVGDWDGDGKDNIGVRMGYSFYLRTTPITSTTETTTSYGYGNTNWIPVVGDWDGNGTDTPSAYDPATGIFYISNNPASGDADYHFKYGNDYSTPFAGDWDGDGKTNVGVRMGYTFYLRTSPVTSATETTRPVPFGNTADLPVIGDWNGDGTDTQGIVR
ncbi:CHAP domain-containing protein [Sphaerisporangium sp. NPDC005288]|uniref:CHAP domain-containing protein n=1 Tax=Sphaerisporangium sp. NPDC005288 TaxID=3155114 RepID=UPI0033A11C1E